MTRPRSIFIHIFSGIMLVLLTAGAAMYGIGGHWMRTFYVKGLKDDLAARCAILSQPFPAMLREGRISAFTKLARAAAATGSRVTVIKNDGRVIFDSEGEPKRMENHNSRPEVLEARDKGIGSRIRFSTTVGRELLYVARTFPPPSGRIPWIIRLALPMRTIENELARVRRYLILIVLIVAGLGGVIAAAVSKTLSTPLEKIAEAAEKFGHGEFTGRVPPGTTRETAMVSLAFNIMAQNLAARINDLKLQHDKLETLFASMNEGVLIIEKNGLIRQANPAAAAFLERSGEKISGRSILEAIRNTELLKISRRTMGEETGVEGTVTISSPEGERWLQVVGSSLKDPAGGGNLAVLVMRDVTSLLRLEGMRREFVANVSHELKTPITAIIGAVETMITDTTMPPESRRNFLAMIQRHSTRLKDLVEDILALSRLENLGIMETAKERHRVEEIISEALSLCDPVLTAKGIKVERRGDLETELRVEFDMMARALSNLIDNGAKYGPENGTITITATRKDDRIEIAVSDQGGGIAATDLKRIFERFYRAEGSRSRELGGTGLGLAIVKHIVEQHHGHVRADSVPGKGATFTITLTAN